MASILSQPVVMVTGLQGHGKTLFALSMLRREVDLERVAAVKEGRSPRPVYYSGIPELALDWEQFGGPSLDPRKPHMTDASRWYELPEGSIIVIDEAQRLFRNRSAGSKVDPHVTALETLRHSGHTLVLITQHPNLLDPNVRMLTGMHFHARRRFGMQRAMVHQWEGVQTSPASEKARSCSVKIPFRFDRRTYSVYKSAEIHTIKRSIPLYWYLMFAVPVLLALGVWYVYGRFDARVHGSSFPPGAAAPGGGGGRPGVSRASPAAPVQVMSYAEGRTPALSGLPFTAPAYAEVVRPKRAPYPAACMQSRSRGCRCYTQDGTYMSMPNGMCESVVANGFFVDWESGSSSGMVVREGVRERAEASASGSYTSVLGSSSDAPKPVPVAPGGSGNKLGAPRV